METYTVIEGTSVTPADIGEALALDELVYPEEYHLTLDQCLAWNARNDRLYTMLRHNGTGRIAAYVNLSPVTEEYYDKIAGGAFLDTLLPPEAIVPYDAPGVYHLYFSSAVVHPEHRNGATLRLLLRAVLRKLAALAEEGIYVDRMAADAVSDGGEKLCRLFGLTETLASTHGSRIYEVTLLPPRFPVTPLTAELHRLMSDHAEPV